MKKFQLGFTGVAVTLALVFTLQGSVFGSYTPTRFVPPGTILPFAGTVAPSGFVFCDGTSYLRITYPTLASTLGCTGTACAYGAADASHFNVPDLRGKFARGSDNMGVGAGGNDPNAASRTACATGGNTGNAVGTCQGQATAVNGLHDTGHTHGILSSSSSVGGSSQGGVGNSAQTATGFAALAGDSETRPMNVAVNYIIKY